MSPADRLSERPDPDLLLAEVDAERARTLRGRLKVFFGMSAGVGKTYAMLEEARKRAAEGVDVLVGYAEPHIRPETESILVALDILPYKPVEYRGATIKEFDLDAALARKPAICCVDELAHTNAPGLRHPKRWQDVAELLDAGINVYTTLNVQHLESVNDLVERITGVRVRETLPDAIFDAADEVELVDIAPDELLERFREGKIYKPEQAERASRHFFTKGNLIALRELALRKTTERVDEQMQQHRRDERLGKLVPSGERVLVCVGPSPLSARLVRSARRLASGLRGKLIALSVEPEGITRRSKGEQAQLDANLKLAEELGARVETVTGRNVAAEAIGYALRHNVTKIVVGKPARPRWRDVLFGSVVDDLIRQSGDIDIYVIRGESDDFPNTQRNAGVEDTQDVDWRGFAAATVVTALITAIGWPLYHQLGIENENVLMLYLLGVLWVAARHSRAAAVFASLLAVAAFDLTFVPPFYVFAVHDRQYVLTFTVMMVTALVISAFSHRVRRQAEGAHQRERRTAALLALGRELSSARNADEIASATRRHVAEAVGAKAVVLLPDVEGKLSISAEVDEPRIDDRDIGAAHWTFEHGKVAGRDTDTLPSCAGFYLPLKGPRGVNGVLGVVLKPGERLGIEQRHMIEAFAAQAAIAVERAKLVDETRIAWERVEAEFLRNTLLSGVSHELRTPLAGITGAATALAEAEARITDDARREMLSTVIDESARMERLINNLLDMTRMESGGLTLKREWTPVGEVIGSAVTRLDRRFQDRAISIHAPADLPLVWLDPSAIEQVITNLLDNAVEYTPLGSPIDITASVAGSELRIEVADRGPGVPAGTEKRVFEKFFRARPGDGSPNRGIGLGLAICRAIVEAHGGTIRVANRGGGGASFTFELPTGGTPPRVEYDGRTET